MSRRCVSCIPPLALLALVPASLSAAASCDLDTARTLHTQAGVAPSPERIDLLQQAWRACPDPKIGYDLGLALLASGDLDQALERFVGARDSVAASGTASERLRPAIQARIAETYLARGEIGRAEAEISFAADLPSGHKHPVVLAVRRAIDTAPARQLMDAEQIGAAMATERLAGVAPRVALFILFDYDQDRPNAEGERQVVELGKALAPLASDPLRILLVGHTDSRGEADYNKALSLRRAEAVKELLKSRHPGLADKLETRGRGEERPRYPGESEENHRLNRRVEVRVLSAAPDES